MRENKIPRFDPDPSFCFLGWIRIRGKLKTRILSPLISPPDCLQSEKMGTAFCKILFVFLFFEVTTKLSLLFSSIAWKSFLGGNLFALFRYHEKKHFHMYFEGFPIYLWKLSSTVYTKSGLSGSALNS